MVDYGVTDTGFRLKTLEVLLLEIQTDERGEMSAAVDVASDQPLGQLNGIFSRQLASLWELAQAVYKSGDPDAAEGDALTSIGKLTGTERRAADYSNVTCTCNLDSGTELVSGEHFASLNDNPESRWTPVEDFTAPSTGDHAVVFRAELTGPVAGPAGEIEVIATSVTGWNGVTNGLDADLGRVADTNPTLRQRREEQLTASGSATVDAIASDLLELDGIQSVTMFENVSDSTSLITGLPPHSFEALIFDGDPADVANNDIAQVIFDSKPAGIQPVGLESGLATSSRTGEQQEIFFNRATPVLMYVDYTLTTDDDTYVGDAAVAAYVAEQANAIFNEADMDVLYSRLIGLPYAQTGVLEVISMRVGTTASPTGVVNVAIPARSIARFAAARVTFV